MATWLKNKKKKQRVRRSVRPSVIERAGTSDGGRTQEGSEEMVRLLWQAIGKDIEVQRRVITLLEEARRDRQPQ